MQSPPPDVHTTGFGMHLRAASQVVLGGVLPVEVAGEAGPCYALFPGGCLRHNKGFHQVSPMGFLELPLASLMLST